MDPPGDPREFVRRLPLMAGCPPRVRAGLLAEMGEERAAPSSGHALPPEVVLTPMAYFLYEFLKEAARVIQEEAGESLGGALGRRAFERVRRRLAGRVPRGAMPTQEEAVQIAALYLRPASVPPPPSPSARRVRTSDDLASGRWAVRVFRPGTVEAAAARLLLLSRVSGLSRRELGELSSLILGLARERLGVDPGDYPVSFDRLAPAASAHPSGGAVIPYDPDSAIPDAGRLAAHLAHEAAGHGFFYRKTAAGRILSRLAAAEASASGVEAAEASDRLRIFGWTTVVVDEGFALWVELAVLRELRPVLGEAILEEEMMRYLLPDSDPYGRTDSEYFERVYGRAVNPYKEGYSALFDLERIWGRRCAVEAVRVAAGIADYGPEGRGVADLRELVSSHPEFCPDQRLMAVRAAALGDPGAARPNDPGAFREFARRALSRLG